ncbi:type II toxin-antitoxin system RelE/ParE family toxin [Flavobacterium sp. ZT3R18]|uniref:type II toxin-antitoxin system RelE/ParE family toxin n=1 Tax=Flavobacterium sp. ZT3R18 TaxID=2594429 RepID=UPI00117AB867|nr:type II toxin-antitoxin system RelE/ParE family toxin [Flavobacterium sp. ZT3R18]TRX33734.1 type II toxin-antitoxin system RelE/ParE family toxin [Flavobacterium sp. ZT3R18]
MNYSLKILAVSKQDIKEIALWYGGKQSNLEKKFINAVKKEVSIIHKNPFLYQIRYDDVRIAFTATFPYSIHFTIYQTTIVIKAVYHTSRNSKIWVNQD